MTGTGTTRTVTVSALSTAGSSVTGVPVTLSSPDFTLSQQVNTGTATAITLPSTAGTYRIFATHLAGSYTQGTAVVTVAAAGLGTLSISPTGAPTNGVQLVNLTARTSGGTIPVGALTVILSGTGFTATGATILNGSVNSVPITLPTTAGTYRLTVSATGYNPASTTLVVGATGQAVTPPVTAPVTPPAAAASVASSITISGPAARSGTVNTQLDSPLLVRVLDDSGAGVASARVIFRVISGRGKLSERGNGRAVGVQTDRSGYARANFTPTDGGTITVRASTDDISATVEFTITTGVSV